MARYIVDVLPCNKFDEFQIATSARGRGVLRLILYERRINLIAIPALCIQIFITAVPSKSRPHMLCVLLKLLVIIVATNRSVAEPAVALGRYVDIIIIMHGGEVQSVHRGFCCFSGYFISTKIPNTLCSKA